MDDLLHRLLRALCNRWAELEAEEGAAPRPARRKYARTYGPPRRVRWQVTITVEPLHPNHKDFDPQGVLRMKQTRLKMAQLLADEISDLLVGYKVKVGIENVHR